MDASITACPRCDKSPLDTLESGYRCSGCKVDFPLVDGIPWLFAEPGAALAEWRSRASFMLRKLEHDRERHLAAERAKPRSALTRRRLAATAAALASHIAELNLILEPLESAPQPAEISTYLALRTKLPIDQGLMTYYANVHRDWTWGDEENRLSAESVARALGGCAPERMLVLGAGAGRLAYDLHERNARQSTVALDFNPLLGLLARRIWAGDAVELHEFPLSPKDLEHVAVLRTLAAPAPARPGLAFVLADAHRPPFAERSFDAVVTPWLVDILPEAFENLCARVNSLLDTDGIWINFGSLSFHHRDPALALSPEECAEIVAAAGFAQPVMEDTEIPYMCSPASRHGRRELTLTWSAKKHTHAKRVPRHEALPDWLVRGKEPVPALDAFRLQAASTRIHAFIMSLIDGRRTLADMAKLFEEQKLMRREEAEPAIRSFLIKMYEDAR
jgi:SAM-dependent methyltransferase/uncharacterized protein YbaR (Trm112 family)